MRCLFVLTSIFALKHSIIFEQPHPTTLRGGEGMRAMRYVERGEMGTPHPAPDVATFPSRGRLFVAGCFFVVLHLKRWLWYLPRRTTLRLACPTSAASESLPLEGKGDRVAVDEVSFCTNISFTH